MCYRSGNMGTWGQCSSWLDTTDIKVVCSTYDDKSNYSQLDCPFLFMVALTFPSSEFIVDTPDSFILIICSANTILSVLHVFFNRANYLAKYSVISTFLIISRAARTRILHWGYLFKNAVDSRRQEACFWMEFFVVFAGSKDCETTGQHQ